MKDEADVVRAKGEASQPDSIERCGQRYAAEADRDCGNQHNVRLWRRDGDGRQLGNRGRRLAREVMILFQVLDFV